MKENDAPIADQETLRAGLWLEATRDMTIYSPAKDGYDPTLDEPFLHNAAEAFRKAPLFDDFDDVELNDARRDEEFSLELVAPPKLR